MSSNKIPSFVFDEMLTPNAGRCADWDYWQLVPTLKVKDAVYLSFNIEPRSMDEVEHLALGMPRLMPKGIKDRVSLAVANLSSNGGKLPVFSEKNSYRNGDSLIKLNEFGYWAKYVMKWDLSSEFPIDEEQQPELEVQNTGLHPCQDQDSEVYAFELDIALQAWYAIAVSKQGREGTPKQRIESWLRASGYQLSEKQIERICVVCNFDKSVGRPKPSK